MNKIFISLFLFLFPAVICNAKESTSLDAGNYDISWYNPEETEITLINARQLAGVAYLVNNGYDSFKNKTIKLTKVGLVGWGMGPSWIPIGTPNNPFQGTVIDESKRFMYFIDNNCINNNSETPNYIGLFGYVKDATFINIRPLSGELTINTYARSLTVGSIVGKAYNSEFINCSSTTPINITVHVSQDERYGIICGGLVGYAEDCNFTNCYTNSDITVSLIGGEYGAFYIEGTALTVGGILGIGDNINMMGCYAGSERHSISVGRAYSKNHCDTYSSIGGLAGSINGKSNLDGCHSEFAEIMTFPDVANTSSFYMTWNRYVGGLVGSIFRGVTSTYNRGIYNCYSASKLNTRGDNAAEGGIAGVCPQSNDWGGNFSWSYGNNLGYSGSTQKSRSNEI